MWSKLVPDENFRNPTWFAPEEARIILAKGREVKYARELQTVIDRALEQIERNRESEPTLSRVQRS